MKAENNLNQQEYWAYLQLMRPANIVTAWADICVGYAASGAIATFNAENISTLLPLGWLILSTTGLYGGGVVFNDVFDAELDAQERPERPIPSGRASRNGAIGLGTSLLILGIIAAGQVSTVSAVVATVVALAALLYDAWGKHNPVLGPVNMGICRGGNLLLGASAIAGMLAQIWFLALIPIGYIAAVTAISQGEVHGGKSSTGWVALLLLAAVIGGILSLEILPIYNVLVALPFVALLTVKVLPAFIKATREPLAENIRQAVRAGVLSLIILDAAIASGFAGWVYGLLVLILLPISIFLAKKFAVT
ncbi:MAG: UbiA-like protein EboC [Microcoleaceae cyanobacterium MO_207.B10]|nr:UbiA-like protein EboC [Microcoleaceae cyanobacterium MO_207.B10]